MGRRYGLSLLVALASCWGLALAQQGGQQQAAGSAGTGQSAAEQKPGEKPAPPPAAKTEPEKKPDKKKEAKAEPPARLRDLKLPPLVLEEALKGLPRKKPDYFKPQPPPPIPEITTSERLMFQQYRNPGNVRRLDDKALQLIDKVVQAQVYSLARVESRSDIEQLPRRRAEIEKILDQPKSVNEAFLRVYKEKLLAYLPELLHHQIWVRINAMKLLAKVREEKAIPVFVLQIRDGQQHEAVKYWAVKGIMYLGLRGLRNPSPQSQLLRWVHEQQLGSEQGIQNVSLRSQAIAALLYLLQQNDPVHPVTRWAIIRALGAVGRPRKAAFDRDANVSLAIVQCLRDPAMRRFYRKDAVVALVGLRIPADLDYNFQLVGYEVACFALETAEAAIRDPLEDDLKSDYFLYLCYTALNSLPQIAKGHPDGSSHGDAGYLVPLRDLCEKLTAGALNIYKPGGQEPRVHRLEDLEKKVQQITQHLPSLRPQIEQLRKHLQQNPPRSMKLTEATAALPPHPVLAPKAPAKKKKPPAPKGKPPAPEAKQPAAPAKAAPSP